MVHPGLQLRGALLLGGQCGAAEAQHGDLGVIQPNDVLLLISNSGKTREILELVDLAERLYPGLPLIVITSKPDSDLGRAADVCIDTGAPQEVCTLGLSPTTSTTVMTVIGDVLIVLMRPRPQLTRTPIPGGPGSGAWWARG